MVPYLSTFPWIEAAVVGALIGLFGAALFIALSSLLLFIGDERRSRKALARCAAANDQVLQDLLAPAETPTAPLPTVAVDRARFAFWTSQGIEGSLWAAKSHEVRPKLPS
jgi:hypothetical protein